jgi:hypothetical protein
MITAEMIDAGARGLAGLLDYVDVEYDQLPERTKYGLRCRAEAVLRAAAQDRAEPSAALSTPYRLSPAGTLAGRVTPGWRVLRAGPGSRHHFGQELTDQHVATWSPLVRKGGSDVG